MTTTSGNTPVSSQIAGVFAEFNSCPQHRGRKYLAQSIFDPSEAQIGAGRRASDTMTQL